MTLRTLIKSPSGIVVLEVMISASLMFATFSILVRVTDLETVGLWVLVNSLLGFSKAADFWSRGLASFVGEARGKANMEEAAAFVTTAIVTGSGGYAVLSITGASLIWIFANHFASDLHSGLVREIIPLMALTFWLISLSGIYGGGFLAFARPALKAAQTIGGGFLFLGLAVILAPEHGLWGILIAQAVQAAVILVISVCVFHAGVVRGQPIRWRLNQFKLLARFGIKAIGVGMVQLAIEPVIRLLANQFGGLGAVAAVELAARLINVVRGVIMSLGQILVPELARLAVTEPDEHAVLYRDIKRFFLVASLSAFSLMATAAPLIEEITLGQSGTVFVALLWILSIGWFANTVAASAYFLLLSRRQMAPLFWSHLIMTLGAILLGILGGLLGGLYGAMGGGAAAIVISSTYLISTIEDSGNSIHSYIAYLKKEPATLMPVLVAFLSIIVLETSDLLQEDFVVRIGSNLAAIVITMLSCIVFGDIRGLIQVATKIR